MTILDRITASPEILNGQPCIRGMRISVRRVIEAVSIYHDWNRVIAEYPELEPEDIHQALEYAARSLDDRIVSLVAA